jgi:hypothetical protein
LGVPTFGPFAPSKRGAHYGWGERVEVVKHYFQEMLK